MNQIRGVAMNRIAPPASPLSPAFRRATLGVAFLLALVVGFGPKSPPAHAQESRPTAPATPAVPAPPPVPPVPKVAPDKKGVEATITIKRDDDVVIRKSGSRAAKGDAATDAPDPDADAADPDVTHGIVIEKGSKKVHVVGIGADREYDSFGQFVNDDPALAAMVVAIVAVIFLSPVLAIALILGYRMRKARMLNETMLKLAEKGIVPPAEALGALTGNTAAAMASGASTAPLYEQAKQIRRKAASSDLRRGVLLGAFGLALTLWSFLDDRTANSIGLVLLFVGTGYIVLWWFEQRQLAAYAPAAGGNGTPGGGAAPGP
jgi:hypothetical protein